MPCGVVSVPRDLAGVFLLCVPVRILFDYSARVGAISLGISPSDRGALSYALWERNRIVVVVTFAIWLADTTATVYGLGLSLPNTGSPDARGQLQQLFARTGTEPFVRLTI